MINLFSSAAKAILPILSCGIISEMLRVTSLDVTFLATLKPQAAPMMGSGTPQVYFIFSFSLCVNTPDFKLILDFGHLYAQKFVSYQFSTFAGNQSGGRSRADRRKSGGDWNHGGDRGEAAGEGNSLDPREKETRKDCSRRIVQQREHETVQCQVQSPWSPLSIRAR